LKYVIGEELLYVRLSSPWLKIQPGTVVEGIPFVKLGDIDKRHFLSIEKTERRKDFNARIFAFEFGGGVRMAVIGKDAKPKREKK
jgi:hypothetical protein